MDRERTSSPASENAKPRLIGKVWRIPIEGLTGVGNQSKALEAKDFLTKTQTAEEADGRAIVLIPDGLDKKGEIAFFSTSTATGSATANSRSAANPRYVTRRSTRPNRNSKRFLRAGAT